MYIEVRLVGEMSEWALRISVLAWVICDAALMMALAGLIWKRRNGACKC
jgi:hypothetical protein